MLLKIKTIFLELVPCKVGIVTLLRSKIRVLKKKITKDAHII